MSKRTIGLLSIISILLVLIGAGLIVVGIFGGLLTPATNGAGFASVPLFVVGVIVAVLALVPHLIARTGALTNLARLQHWGWFVPVLAFHGIGLMVYLIVGPTALPARAHKGASLNEPAMRCSKRW